jgi:hypothetical protein
MRLNHGWRLAAGSTIVVAVLAVVLRGGESPRRRVAASRPTFATSRPASAPAARSLAANPHWVQTGCQLCHVGDPTGQTTVPRGEIDGICLRCHDGRRAHQEVHPVGRAFTTEQVRRPEGWPLVEGRLGCVTCHDIRGLGHRIGRPPENPDFLRGPYQSLAAFCAVCHVNSSTQSRYNPHRMLKSDGKVDEGTCAFCHEGDISKRIGENARIGPDLKRDVISLCLGCHTQHLDWFDPGHVGRKAPAKIRAQMLAFESTPTGKPVDAAHLQEALRSEKRPQWLPLGPEDRVVCSTCHNPHQEGVFPEDSVLSRGGQSPAVWSAPSGRKNLPLRGLGEEVCRECHDK